MKIIFLGSTVSFYKNKCLFENQYIFYVFFSCVVLVTCRAFSAVFVIAECLQNLQTVTISCMQFVTNSFPFFLEIHRPKSNQNLK